MTHQEYLFQNVIIIDSLLRYLPFCDNSTQRDAIMEEVRRSRKIITDIEDMTKTEKQRDIKFLKLTIESKMNL